MNKSTLFGLFAIIFLACMTTACGNQGNQPLPSAEAPLAPTDPQAEMTGAYAEADVNSEEVQQAAWFAVKELIKQDAYKNASIAGIQKAESQIVAGTNYRLILSIGLDGEILTATAVVYKKLDGIMELTSIEF